MSKAFTMKKPAYYGFLSDAEKVSYDILQARLADPDQRYTRHHRMDQFRGMLVEIHEFCEGVDSWRRCLACGICWGSNFIATNTQQLTFLLGKSKSSINGVLAQLGLALSAGNKSDTDELFARIPFLSGRAQELRQWTIRRMMETGIPAEVFPVVSDVSVTELPIDDSFPEEIFVFDDGFQFDWVSFDPFLYDSDSCKPFLHTDLPQTDSSSKERQFAL
jgi:hypothetical protein